MHVCTTILSQKQRTKQFAKQRKLNIKLYFTGMGYISQMLKRTSAYGAYKKYMKKLVDPLYNRHSDPKSKTRLEIKLFQSIFMTFSNKKFGNLALLHLCWILGSRTI